jgi:four helix bundle protein
MRFEALDVALSMVRTVKPLIDVVRRQDRNLGDQMRNAAASAQSCLAEGNRRIGGDRLQLWRIALGSAGEVQAQLQIARAWGYAADAKLDECDAIVDRMCAILYRLTTPRR